MKTLGLSIKNKHVQFVNEKNYNKKEKLQEYLCAAVSTSIIVRADQPMATGISMLDYFIYNEVINDNEQEKSELSNKFSINIVSVDY